MSAIQTIHDNLNMLEVHASFKSDGNTVGLIGKIRQMLGYMSGYEVVESYIESPLVDGDAEDNEIQQEQGSSQRSGKFDQTE